MLFIINSQRVLIFKTYCQPFRKLSFLVAFSGLKIMEINWRKFKSTVFKQTKTGLNKKSMFRVSNNLELLIDVWCQIARRKKIIASSNMKEKQQCCWLLEIQGGPDLISEFPATRIVAKWHHRLILCSW